MKAMTRIIRYSAFLLMVSFLLVFTACNGTPSGSETQTQAATVAESKADATGQASEKSAAKSETGSGKTLVVYFSATGTTKGVAEKIASAVKADTYEILAAQPYTTDDLNWHDSNSRTTKEQNDKSVRPKIGSDKLSLDDYATVFIGYPIWWGEEPRIMDTFVESYDFNGKTVIPFCTSGGSGIGSSGTNLAANAGGGNWLEGERLSSSSDIDGWIKGLNLQ